MPCGAQAPALSKSLFLQMNQPDRYSRFILQGDKVTYKKDDKVQDAGTFTINNEDHTIGNLCRMQLHEDRHVVFSGYRIPHPLENKMLVMISTDGFKSPCAAMEHCLEDLKLEFQGLREQFVQQASSMALYR